MRVCLTLVLTCWLLPLSACTELVLIGYECPEGQARCGETDSRPPRMDAGGGDDARTDAQAQDGGPAPDDARPMDAAADADAAPPEDAGVDSSSFEYLLENPSFEITEGDAGPLEGPLGGSAKVVPWVRCLELPGVLEGVDVLTEAMEGEVLPTDGMSFLQFTLVVSPGFATLTQELTRTWKAGETRAITVDVTAAGLGFDKMRLAAQGSATMCPTGIGERELLAIGDTVDQSATWTEVCMEMTPTVDTNWLMLTADPAAVSLDTTSRVFLDNLRETDHCPEPEPAPEVEMDSGLSF